MKAPFYPLISTEDLQCDLLRLMDIQGNQRIIISGVFGIGKTTFLREIAQKNKDKFITIHLFPVSYSVARNEDIFELIKYDVLYSLIEHNPDFEKLDLSWYESLHFLSYQDVYKIMANFVSLIPKFGKEIRSVLDGLENLIGSLNKIHLEKKKAIEIDEISKVLLFAEKIENSSGGIYENDFYSHLIEVLVSRLKVENAMGRREVILIIDDLDRIDPEHIFRILNVFAAHFDVDRGKNKFGIDKIILCCDIENIRRIFCTKYGPDVDFNGYIDKFFSKGIFSFRNKSNISSAIPTIISTIKPCDQKIKLFDSGHHLNYMMIYLYKQLMQVDNLNLRVLLKYANNDYNLPQRAILINGAKEPIWRVPIFTLVEFMVDAYGSFQSFLVALERIDFDLTTRPIDSDLRNILGDILLLAGWNGSLPTSTDDPKTLGRYLYHDNQRLGYSIVRDGSGKATLFYGQVTDVLTVPQPMQKDLLLRGVRLYGAERF